MLREEIKRSREVTQPLIEHIIKKDRTYSSEMKANQLQARKEVKAKKSKVIEEADLLAQALDEQQKMSNDPIARERQLPLADFSSNGRTWTQPPQGPEHFKTNCASDMGGIRKGCLQLGRMESNSMLSMPLVVTVAAY